MQLADPATYDVDRAANKARLEQLRTLTDSAERVAVLLQDDPDPDGIASAIALRTVLGRNRATTPLFSFGTTTRAENLAMLRLLDVSIDSADTETLRGFPCIALLDVQPAYFEERIPHAHVVIDHHPRVAAIDAEYSDLRPQYGATSTILTEYLEACQADVSQRLATALLYGIKSDTLMLNRETGPADLRAFMALYPLTNYNVLRRIERPELPLSFARFLVRVLPRVRKHMGLLTLSAGRVMWCASCSTPSAGRAGIAPWPRPECRCGTGASTSARPVTPPLPAPLRTCSYRICTARRRNRFPPALDGVR
jgi:nanoRNase/pAp phosphatase (c-di-AMP/oligoRNAs hydrolase)